MTITVLTKTTDFTATRMRDEEGSMTLLSLMFVLICLVMGGVAVDFNKAIAERTQMQIAVDSAAHAAIYTRERETKTASIDKAMFTVAGMLPEHQFGANALTNTDIVFGEWDRDNNTFNEDASAKSAVRVRAQMVEERGNASRNLLLSIIGQDTFNITTESVYTTYYPPCFNEGFVAEDVVDIQSNNSFTDGFCIHSNDYVSLNQNNFFEPGTVVSMPDLGELDMPNSGFEKNEGLEASLRQGEYRLRILNQLPGIIDSFWSADAEHLPPYVTPGFAYDIDFKTWPSLPPNASAPTGNGLTPYHFEQNAVNRLNCSGGGKVTMDAGVYSNILFITDCEIKFSNGVILEDAVIATTNTSATSLNSPQGLQIGRDDNCAVGGGATLMTLGGFNAAASLAAFNGQILAMGDIEFAARADGIEGASFISYGEISGTSNMSMGFCANEGMEDAYRAQYFRPVM